MMKAYWSSSNPMKSSKIAWYMQRQPQYSDTCNSQERKPWACSNLHLSIDIIILFNFLCRHRDSRIVHVLYQVSIAIKHTSNQQWTSYVDLQNTTIISKFKIFTQQFGDYSKTMLIQSISRNYTMKTICKYQRTKQLIR